MTQITANDLKTRGIAAIEASLAGGRTEAMVSVRGADRLVAMELAQYQHLRECELEAAVSVFEKTEVSCALQPVRSRPEPPDPATN